MTERDRQTEFLMRLVVLTDPQTQGDLHSRVEQAHHDEKCIRFALILVALIGGFAVSGLGYCSVLHPEFFDSTAPTLVKIFSAVALGSLICLIVFVCCWWWYRSNSNRVYEECRRLVIDAINARLRNSSSTTAFVKAVDFSSGAPADHQHHSAHHR